MQEWLITLIAWYVYCFLFLSFQGTLYKVVLQNNFPLTNLNNSCLVTLKIHEIVNGMLGTAVSVIHFIARTKGELMAANEDREAFGVVVLSILILHYNMYYFHFTLQEPC